MAVNGRMRMAPTWRDDLGADLAGLVRTAALLVLVAGMALSLAWLTGPPRLPHIPPDIAHIREVLAGSEIPEADVLFLTSLAGWVVLAYLALILTLRSLVLSVLCWCGATRAAWGLWRLLDPLTLPAMRRLTDGALAGALVTSVWVAPPAKARAATVSAVVPLPVPAAPAPRAALGWVVIDGQGTVALVPGGDAAPLAQPERLAVPYTVVAGDTVWRIAERMYGDGQRYHEILAANAGRVMPTGEQFGDPRLVRPGWVLHIPLPATHVTVDGAEFTYEVQTGDSLWRVAAHLLGDGMRWSEIWERNRGRDMGDGRAFTNPGVLVPGWRLHLPPAELVAVPNAPPPAPPPPSSGATPPATEPPATATAVPTASPAVSPELLPPDRPALPAPEPAGDGGVGWMPSPGVVAAAAGLVAAGSAVAVMHRRLSTAVAGGPAHRPRPMRGGKRGHRGPVAVQGDVERVRLAGRLVLAGLGELGFGEVRLVTCQEDLEALVLRLACPPGDADALTGARFSLARRLGCLIDARVLPGHQVELTLTRLRREAAALFTMTHDDERRLLIVPVGAADGVVTYLNLAGVSGIAVHGTDIETAGLLRTWLATLAASVVPGAYVVARAPSQRIPAAPDEVGVGQRWSSEELGTTTNLIATLETQLAARLSRDVPSDDQPAIVVLLSADPDLDADRVETLLRRGRQAYIHTVMLFAGGVDEADASHVTSGCEAVVTCAGAQNANELPPGSLTLAVGGSPTVTLQPVQLPGNDDDSGPPGRHDEPVDEDRPFAGGVTANGILPRVREPSAGIGDGAAGISVRDGDGVAEADAPPSPWSGASLGGARVTAEAGSDEPSEPVRRGMLQPAPPVSPEASHQMPLAREGSEPDDDARGEQSSSKFDVRCYGGFTVRLGDTEVVNWKMQKARELLAYLLARGGVAVPREEAGEALWPELDPEQMQRMLSDAAYHLRRALKEVGGDGTDPLITQGQRYHLRQELFRVDLNGFEAHLRRAAALPAAEAIFVYERALEVARQELFSGEPFEWAGPFRQARQGRFVQAVHAAAKLAMQCRDTERAAGFYRSILEREPTDEEAARGLMRSLALLGDTNGVRKVYKALVATLRRELDDPDAEPLPDTTALLRELTDAQ